MNNNVFTIQNIIEKIDSKEILLPAMQRKFVWDEERIVCFFDSLLKDYPFGVFIFWNIENNKEQKEYHFYQFIKNYSERENTINESSGRIIKDCLLVMDGQQRLTSLYIGIKGSIEKKIKWKHLDKTESWEKKRLYIRPFIPYDERDEESNSFEFCFLTDDFVKDWNEEKSDPKEKYYPVSKFYGLQQKQLYESFGIKRIRSNDKYEDWRWVLEKLRQTLNDNKIVHIQSIKNADLVSVLEVFRRINSGGIQLSPAQLLFSTLITSWEEGRDLIDEFIKSINQENVFILKEDALIRICLYLINEPSKIKIGVLTSDTVERIKTNWKQIKESIIETKNFLKDHNIYNKAIVSFNAIIPIIYYFYHSSNQEQNSIQNDTKKQLFKYFVISQMFSLLGSSSTTVLDSIRKKMCINGTLGELITPFNVENLYGLDLSGNRLDVFNISKGQIYNLIDSIQYGDKQQNVLLSILQPSLKMSNNEYDVDHICSKKELKELFKHKRGENRQVLERMKNSIINLQLLNDKENREEKKADTLFTWIVEKKNKIPCDPYEEESNDKYKLNSIEDFEDFYNKRRKKIANYLCEILLIEDKKKK